MNPVEKAALDIKNFRIQGANQIAIFAMKFLRSFAKRHGFKLKFEVAAQVLKSARPTAVVLHNCIEAIKKKKSIDTIDRLIRTLQTAGDRESRYSDRIVKNGDKIMTYCHSGEAMKFIKHAWIKHKRKISVIACETEPLEQGTRTARELADDKIHVTLIGDNAIGFFMKNVDLVVIGADAIRKEGVVNKIGTKLLALAAKAEGKPLYVVANSLKIDKRKKFIIEERPAREIYTKMINKKKMEGIRIRNPAFDITPWKNITAVINENGIIKPEKMARIISR